MWLLPCYEDGGDVSCEILIFIVNTQSISVTETSSLTIVESNGIDELKCLDGGTSKPCLALGYVFNNIHHLTCDNCTVLVTYSHEISSYNLNYYQHLTVLNIVWMEGL